MHPARLVRLLLARPTWIAQGVNALSSLLLVSVLTRSLQVDAFATYAAVLAAYAFANALVGTTIGTRAIQGLSAGGQRHIVFDLRRDLPPVVGCLFVAAATTLIVKVDPVVALAAATGMLGILVAELGGAYPLGLRQLLDLCATDVGADGALGWDSRCRSDAVAQLRAAGGLLGGRGCRRSSLCRLSGCRTRRGVHGRRSSCKGRARPSPAWE